MLTLLCASALSQSKTDAARWKTVEKDIINALECKSLNFRFLSDDREPKKDFEYFIKKIRDPIPDEQEALYKLNKNTDKFTVFGYAVSDIQIEPDGPNTGGGGDISYEEVSYTIAMPPKEIQILFKDKRGIRLGDFNEKKDVGIASKMNLKIKPIQGEPNKAGVICSYFAFYWDHE